MTDSVPLFPEVLQFTPVVHRDQRGYFFEAWKQSAYRDQGLTDPLVQLNISRSERGVLRGLHYQLPRLQGKLVGVLEGEIYDVVADIRIGSPTFGRWRSYCLDAGAGRQIYVPEGFAHGFQVVSDHALVAYMCSREYDAEGDRSLAWNDPDLQITWPLEPAAQADKDRQAPHLGQLTPEQLPRFTQAVSRVQP